MSRPACLSVSIVQGVAQRQSRQAQKRARTMPNNQAQRMCVALEQKREKGGLHVSICNVKVTVSILQVQKV